jgi:hypothetical protein
MIDPELRSEFEAWYAAQTADDPEFELCQQNCILCRLTG